MTLSKWRQILVPPKQHWCRFFYIFSVSQVFTNEYKSLLNLLKAVFVLIRSSEKTTRKGIKNIQKKTAMQKICVKIMWENLQLFFKCWHIHIDVTDFFLNQNIQKNCFNFKAIIIILKGPHCRLVVWHKKIFKKKENNWKPFFSCYQY